MTTVNRSFITSVFNDNDQAQQTMNDLRLAGFREDQIRCERQNGILQAGEDGISKQSLVKGLGLGGGIGALLGTGAGFFLQRKNSTIATHPLWETLLEGAGVGTALGGLLGLAVGRKVSQEQMDTNAGEVASVLILVEDDHRPQDVLDILSRNGASDIHPGVERAIQLSAPTPAVNSRASMTTNQTVPSPAARPTRERGTTAAPTTATPPATARSGPPLVVAAFSNRGQALQAIDALQGAGFHNDQIRYSEHGPAGGGILNHLLSLGVPQQEAYTYEREFEMGHTVVTVRTPDRQEEATNVLRSQGAYNLKLLSSQPGTATSTTSPSSQTEENVRLREERLRVNKQQVQSGEVDVHREVVSEEKTITVPTTREEVVVEYQPTSEASSNKPVEEGETIRIPVSEEQVHVTKETVQTGDVTIGKRPVEEVQRVTEPISHEEIHVERKGDTEVVDNTSTNPPNREG